MHSWPCPGHGKAVSPRHPITSQCHLAWQQQQRCPAQTPFLKCTELLICVSAPKPRHTRSTISLAPRWVGVHFYCGVSFAKGADTSGSIRLLLPLKRRKLKQHERDVPSGVNHATSATSPHSKHNTWHQHELRRQGTTVIAFFALSLGRPGRGPPRDHHR